MMIRKRMMAKKLGITAALSLCLVGGISNIAYGMEEDKKSHSPALKDSKTQEEINEICARTAKEIYNRINANWHYIGPKEKMYTQSKMWESIQINGQMQVAANESIETTVNSLLLKTQPQNLKAALQDLISKKASLECTIAQTVVQIFCLSELLGEKNFNLYATAFYRLLETKDNWDIKEFFHEVPKQFLKQKELKSIQEVPSGTATYICNIPHYSVFKPTGNGRGYNVFCVGQDQYAYFSPPFQENSRSLKMLEEECYKEFCETEDVEIDSEKHASVVQIFQKNPNIFYKTRTKEQEKHLRYDFFDKVEIDDFIKSGEISI